MSAIQNPASWPPTTTEIIEARRKHREQEATDERDHREQNESDRLRRRAAVRAKIRVAKLAEIRLAAADGSISDAGLVKAVSESELDSAKATAKATLEDIDRKQLSRLERGQAVDIALETKRRELLDDLAARETALNAVLERQNNLIAVLSSERRELATSCNTSGLEAELFATGDPEKVRDYHERRRSGFARQSELSEMYAAIVAE